ncbi:MAG: energy-coupling factor ABC transporter permease [Intestinimonas sp.]
MAIAGLFCVSWGVCATLPKKAKTKPSVAVFYAAAPGDLLTHVTTSVQLGVVHGNFGEYLAIFAATQIPLAIAEGLLTAVVFNVLEKYSAAELQALSVL